MVLSGSAAPESGSGVGPPPGLPNEFYLRGPSFPQQGYALHRSHLAKIHADWVEYAMPRTAREENWNLPSSLGQNFEEASVLPLRRGWPGRTKKREYFFLPVDFHDAGVELAL